MAIFAIIATFGTLSFAATTATTAYAQTTVQNTVTILGVCGLTPDPTAIDYGQLLPDQVSSEQTLGISNTGNTQSSVSVMGTPWGNTNPPAMLVGATHYSLQSESYDDKEVLTDSNAALTTVNAQDTVFTFWQVKTTLNNPAAIGPQTQFVTLTGTC